MPPLWLAAAAALSLAQLALPARWAFIPLWIAACHSPYTSFLGGVTLCRIVIIIGLARAFMSPPHRCCEASWNGAEDCRNGEPQRRRTRPANDWLVACFALMLLASAMAHESTPFSNPLVTRLRMVLDIVGAYAYMRCWSLPPHAMTRMATALGWIVIPFAILLLVESFTATNPYRWIGSEHLLPQLRDGRVRAQGPFGTPILSGTVGAVVFPLLIPLHSSKRTLFFAATAACLIIVITSGSSGPISSLLVCLCILAGWRWRHAARRCVAAGCVGLLLIQLIKERPIWYLMALTDFVGGSTGWHRAYLIDAAFAHLEEWFLAGCDRTSHWMPYALAAVPNHCDLTNYYLHLGVTAGAAPIAVLIAILLRALPPSHSCDLQADPSAALIRWCLTAALCTHAITFLSISYFDQISVFFWGLLGSIPALLETNHDR